MLRTACMILAAASLGGCAAERSSPQPRMVEPAPTAAQAPASPGAAAPVPAVPPASTTRPDEPAGAPASDDPRSRYSSLRAQDCTLEFEDKESQALRYRCPGVGGFGLAMHDSDARMSLDLIPTQGARQPLDFWQLAGGAFSSLGETAEWRLDEAGKPVALIVRFNAYEHPEQPDRSTSYLVVARIETARSCVTGMIPPGPGQNLQARRAADEAAGQPCLTPPA